MATTTPLTAYPVRLPSPSVRFLCEAWWTCYSAGQHTWRTRSDLFLATGEPLSVIPRPFQQSLAFVIRPDTAWRGQAQTWRGVPCRIGRVSLWVPSEETAGLLRELSLLALLPRHEVEEVPPYVLLGTQFLIEHRAQVVLDGSVPGAVGKLVIP